MDRPLHRLWNRCRQIPLLRWQLEFARQTADAESASILLLDDEDRNLVFCVSVGRHAETYTGAGVYAAAMRVPLDSQRGITPLAVIYGKSMYMEPDDPRHNPDIDRKVGTRTRNLFVIPLATRDGVLGAFGAINAHQSLPPAEQRFELRDREAMQAAAEATELWMRRAWQELKDEPEDLRSK